MTDVNTDPVHLHVEDTEGAGRPVVLIHGWPLSGAAWEYQVPALTEAGYRVVTYDRRGFGRSDKTGRQYDYNTLATDLARILDERDLNDVTLVGFSMGGGEVARFIALHGEERLRSIVFAAAVPPYLLKTANNPEGPLSNDEAEKKKKALLADRDAFFEEFTTNFFSTTEGIKVSDEERGKAVRQCRESGEAAALGCMDAFSTTDFRDDLKKITVPTLVLHGDADLIVPLEGSGLRTHKAVSGSRLAVIPGAPHGLNVSHADDFNNALAGFLSK
ncbi:MAG: alpha/beta fold hydrolase [Pseudochelatococcus sp.]|jgi:non-heme chloroperoxidase|uniref:alpha/beta fold hydrolase n=1 Tax=Pseudochelatococcus sp. TaxID=2020869 RepID=UPI003D8CEB47